MDSRKRLIVCLIFGALFGFAGGLMWESTLYAPSVFRNYTISKTLNTMPIMGINKREAPVRSYAPLLRDKSPELAARLDFSILRAAIVHTITGMFLFFLGFSFIRGGQK